MLSCSSTKCLKRRRSSDSQSEEPTGTRARRESEQDVYSVASSQSDASPVGDGPAFFTPPYSPASSSSPLQQEEISHDLLMDVNGYTDQLLSSPEGSPTYYSYPEPGLTCHQSPPDSLPSAAVGAFDQAASSTLTAHSPLLSPAYDFQASTSDARLVPDTLSVSDLCDIPLDCILHQEDLNLLEQPQGGSADQVQHVPHHMLPPHPSLLTPNQSPTSTQSGQYNEREQAEISILAQQISSLASSFASHRTLSPLHNAAQHPITDSLASACSWPSHPLETRSELILDDGVFDSILKDLDLVTRKSSPAATPCSYQQNLLCSFHQVEREAPSLSPTLPDDLLPAERFPAVDAFSLRMGRHDQNTGLHQLNHYMQSGLHQGNFLPHV